MNEKERRQLYFERLHFKLLALRGTKLLHCVQDGVPYSRQRPDRCVLVRKLREQKVDMHHGGNHFLSNKYIYDEPHIYWAEDSHRNGRYRQNIRQHRREKRRLRKRARVDIADYV